MKIWLYIIPLMLVFACQEGSNDEELENMIFVQGGNFYFGEMSGKDDESPDVSRFIPSFFLDQNEVTNKEFEAFINATDHITSAETFGFSMVYTNKWEMINGVKWNHNIFGNDSMPANFNQLPVVHVSWHDAKAYCEWRKKRLPTEEELEFAMSASDEKMNIWEGAYPDSNTMNDGYYFTAPVGSFYPNDLGFYDLQGNVWEWTEDNYNYNVHDILYFGSKDTSQAWDGACYDPNHVAPETMQKVIKGGSFLCHHSYCEGYKPTARMPAEPQMTYFHIGFRCACDE